VRRVLLTLILSLLAVAGTQAFGPNMPATGEECSPETGR
jgi:hypothetical protein